MSRADATASVAPGRDRLWASAAYNRAFICSRNGRSLRQQHRVLRRQELLIKWDNDVVSVCISHSKEPNILCAAELKFEPVK